MKLVIQTQYHENYGTEESPRWKSKGATEFIVENYENKYTFLIDKDVNSLKSVIEFDSSMAHQTITGRFLAEDDYMSGFEQDQLEFDGVIDYYEPRVTLDGKVIRTTRNFHTGELDVRETY